MDEFVGALAGGAVWGIGFGLEEVLGFLGLSAGASFGVSMVRSVGTGAQPAVREVLKIGIRAWDRLANAARSVSQEVEQARTEAAAGSARLSRGAPASRRASSE